VPLLVSSFAVIASLVLGGATPAGSLADASLQLFSIPLVLASAWRLLDAPLAPAMRSAFALWFCLALVPLVQLVPLPPQIWTLLPNRYVAAATYDLLGHDAPWLPLSVAPRATWLAILSLLPPFAVFLSAVSLSYGERRQLTLIVLAVGAVEVMVGLLQLSQGPESSLRFFDDSNEMVGFFANRNHFAALLCALLVVSAVWAIHAAEGAAATGGGTTSRPAFLMAAAASFTLVVSLIAAQAMTRSRAGLGLTIIALLGVFAIAVVQRRRATGITPARLLAAATALALLLSTQFALYRVLDRLDQSLAEDARVTIARNTVELAKAYMPFGSGVGTFVTAYGLAEKAEDALPNTFINRAHNEVLEVWLEAGIVGLGLMALFAAWFIARSVRAWRRTSAACDIDRSLARAATLIIGLLIAHSLVDYPLRSGAMMAVMALACALLVEPPVQAGDKQRKAEGGRRESMRSGAGTESPAVGMAVLASVKHARRPVPDLVPTIPAAPGGRWGEGIAWPEEWRTGRARDPGSAGPVTPTRK
jgi:O-antigen ligase